MHKKLCNYWRHGEKIVATSYHILSTHTTLGARWPAVYTDETATTIGANVISNRSNRFFCFLLTISVGDTDWKTCPRLVSMVQIPGECYYLYKYNPCWIRTLHCYNERPLLLFFWLFSMKLNSVPTWLVEENFLIQTIFILHLQLSASVCVFYSCVNPTWIKTV